MKRGHRGEPTKILTLAQGGQVDIPAVVTPKETMTPFTNILLADVTSPKIHFDI
jgi:hypothetical protein